MGTRNKHYLWLTALALVGLLWLLTCGKNEQKAVTVSVGGQEVNQVIQQRGLTAQDVYAAVKTYIPTGKHDEYIMFASGGHSGQVLVIGVPSMRLLKVIGVFTPEPWQGWGFSKETREVLAGGNPPGKTLTWGDVHHPGLSETGGDYDGQFLFVNDKANSRVAVIDLRDFETKQIVKNPISLSDHGGTFVTPNTEYVIEGGQYAMPLNGQYASLDQYKEKYRGMITFWKFDRKKGRLVPGQSFALELPPYWQDLSDAGKQVSEGWVFLNSFNTEMATGGVESGNPPFEAGASQRDMDYLHVINLRKAEQLFKAGKTKKINGFNVLPLDVLIKEGVLYFVPEPKSPHGIDVTPDGNYLVVSGKLDPHVTIYNFTKIKQAIEKGQFKEHDPYGVPIIDFDTAMEAQVEVGLGPLHTQFDPNGYAYTSLFLESAVARWTLGGQWTSKHGKEPWTLVDKVSVHYNIGHLAVAEGDNVHPDGKYLVALNKWSIDRFANVGPLLPQNFQLVDIASKDQPMKLLYDMPIGIGEPHYAQIIKADKIKAWEVYPEIGWDPSTQSKHPKAVQAGGEKIVRRGKTVEVFMTAVRSHYTPEHVEVKKGDRVIWHITNIERARDATHGFALPYYNFNLSIEPGETQTIEFVADRAGVYPFYCTEFCSALHLEMAGYFLVKP
ncbi:MAG: Sec-dependent nitrous-oxide reductase [Calditrichaeota bacterium]|nr:MAG: Sec-dependent nitrous-oxide reductase [Calditrichota bacterium]